MSLERVYENLVDYAEPDDLMPELIQQDTNTRCLEERQVSLEIVKEITARAWKPAETELNPTLYE